ncbi:hypothetical protein ACJMK2_004112 [Sinanodonta woodiana]|uniref:ILCR1 Ig-like domain-containing protein n=1 Tax=Sinanodonta woodiana TaxID=1069815 RepID=A0ABD3Y2V9_SINWO
MARIPFWLWSLVYVILFCEFSICMELNCTIRDLQGSLPCRLHFFAKASDCEEETLSTQIPVLFENITSLDWPGPPGGLNVQTIEKKYTEDGTNNKLYPGIKLSLKPPQDASAKYLKGFIVVIANRNNKGCLVFDISNVTWTIDLLDVQFEHELFPVRGNMQYDVTASSLPYPPMRFKRNDLRRSIVSSRWGWDANQQFPADWTTSLSFRVFLEDDMSWTISVSFTRPPIVFNFSTFIISLIPTDFLNIQSIRTVEFQYNFTEVKRGWYKIGVNPHDEHFSYPGLCLCYRRDRVCDTCIRTETQYFKVG